MADLKSLQEMLIEAVPFNRLLGVEIFSVGTERVEVRLPPKPEHHNHVGTVHAAAQYGLGEAASGAMAASAFGDLIVAGLTPLATQATITYTNPAQGELHALASLSQAEQERVRQEIAQKGRARFVVNVALVGHQELVVSELTVEWILLKLRPKAAQ